jgi:hypothetical protein
MDGLSYAIDTKSRCDRDYTDKLFPLLVQLVRQTWNWTRCRIRNWTSPIFYGKEDQLKRDWWWRHSLTGNEKLTNSVSIRGKVSCVGPMMMSWMLKVSMQLKMMWSDISSHTKTRSINNCTTKIWSVRRKMTNWNASGDNAIHWLRMNRIGRLTGSQYWSKHQCLSTCLDFKQEDWVRQSLQVFLWY